MNTSGLRQFIRHPSDVPIECRVASLEPVQLRGQHLKDISAGGLCFQTAQQLRPGWVVHLTIPVRKPAFEVMATVIWCKPLNAHYEAGVKFADAGAEFAVRMVEQVCQIHHYQRQVWQTEGRKLSAEEAAVEWVRRHAEDFPD